MSGDGPSAEQRYDLFISYATEDREWVEEHLYQPLRACLTAAGTRPRIFFDVSDEGIQPGMNYLDALTSALQRSQHILLVYSRIYFTKEMCDWESSLACKLDPRGSGRIVPILKESAAFEKIPLKLGLHQFLSTELPDWFERLVKSVELTVDRASPTLSFRTSPGDTIVNHTLAPVEVAVLDSSTQSPLPVDEPITIRAEGGELQGTLTLKAQVGVAAFADLSLAGPAPQIRLIAEAPGCAPVASEPFAVREPPSPLAAPAARDRGTDGTLRIPARGTDLFFFADGDGLAVLGPEKLEVYRGDVRVGQAEFRDRVRLMARSANCLAFADWSGRVVLAHRDGRVRSVRLGADGRVLTVPGGLCFMGDEAFVGLWNGTVWSLSVDAPDPVRRFEHGPGIRALQVARDRWMIAGLDGKLTVVGPDGTAEWDLSPDLLALQAWPDCIVGIGEHEAYRLGLDSGRLVQEALPVARVAQAIADTELAVVVDSDGKGVRLDRQLTLRDAFHTTRGARLVAADGTGRSVVFAYPGGSYAVMLEERVVFSTTSGPVTISPDGRRIALAQGDSVTISPTGAIFASCGQGEPT